MQFLVATTNKGKLREFRSILEDRSLRLVSLQDLPSRPPQPEETGSTFSQNARLKADYYCQATGISALADDSGLVVDALKGEPGIHSARWAPTDQGKVDKLLRALAGKELEERTARFICALCLVLADGRRLEVQGKVEGLITTAPRGGRGFGYDPVFLYPPLGRTFSELSPHEKNQVSHRADALRKLREKLELPRGRDSD